MDTPLIKDATRHADKPVFRLPADSRQRRRFNFESKQFPQCHSRRQLQCRAAGQAGARWQVSRDRQIKPHRKIKSLFLQRPRHAGRVIRPRRLARKRRESVQRRFHRCAVRLAKNPQPPVRAPARRTLHPTINGRPDDQAAVVINMVADEFQPGPARSRKPWRRFDGIGAGKTGVADISPKMTKPRCKWEVRVKGKTKPSNIENCGNCLLGDSTANWRTVDVPRPTTRPCKKYPHPAKWPNWIWRSRNHAGCLVFARCWCWSGG